MVRVYIEMADNRIVQSIELFLFRPLPEGIPHTLKTTSFDLALVLLYLISMAGLLFSYWLKLALHFLNTNPGVSGHLLKNDAAAPASESHLAPCLSNLAGGL